MSRPVIPYHQSSRRVSVVTDAADFSPQYKVSLTKGILNPGTLKATSPQKGYYLDSPRPANIHTHQPISPSRKVLSPSARARERFQILADYILNTKQQQNEANLISKDIHRYEGSKRSVVMNLDTLQGVEIFEQRQNLVPIADCKLRSIGTTNTHFDLKPIDGSTAQGSQLSQQLRASNSGTHLRSRRDQRSSISEHSHSPRRFDVRKAKHEQPTQQIILALPSLFEIIPFFPASTILYFITEEEQSSFSDALQRASALKNIVYVRLYDVIPIRNCPGVEECTDYLSVQSKTTGAHVNTAPWEASPQPRYRGEASSYPRRTSSRMNTQRKVAPHIIRLADDISTNIQKSTNKQTMALASASKIIEELTSATVTSGCSSECLTQLITTCLLSIQEDNILCDPNENVENLKLNGDLAIRTVAVMVNKNVVGLIKKHLSESMSYTCGKMVVERQLFNTHRHDFLPNSAFNRYRAPTYAILNRLQILAHAPVDSTIELLELTVAFKRLKNFAHLVHTAAILCLVGPGIKDSFFTGQFMCKLGNFTGRLLVDKSTFIQANCMYMLHISLAALCRLNYSFGYILLPYTTQALHLIFKELVSMITNGSAMKSRVQAQSQLEITDSISPKRAYYKTTYNNTTAIHALNKVTPQTDEEKSIRMEHIMELQEQGMSRVSSYYQGITVNTLASLIYLHAGALYATIEYLSSALSSDKHSAVVSKAFQYTIEICGKILQWISGLSPEIQKAIYGQGPKLTPSITYILQTTLLPNIYVEEYVFGLSKFELQFRNLEVLVNIFIARLLNQARRARIITGDDMQTIAAGLIRDPDAKYLLQNMPGSSDSNNPLRGSMVTTRTTSGIDDTKPAIDLDKVTSDPVILDTVENNTINYLRDQEGEKLADYFEEDNSEVSIDKGFI